MNDDRRDIRRARPVTDHRAGYAEGQPTDHWGHPAAGSGEEPGWPGDPWEGRRPFGPSRGWPEEPRSWQAGAADRDARPREGPHPSDDRARWEAHTWRRGPQQRRWDESEAVRSGLMPRSEGAWWAERAPPAPRARGTPPRGYRRSDERIREDVSEQLMDAGINCGNLEVAVKDGVVTLTGEVEHRQDRYAAEQVAADLSGVRDVENNLRVAGARTPPSTAPRPQAPADAPRPAKGRPR